ncbi:hypothetical protein Agabi119p4_1192 [Agaricus bisporus var. burnettii]|uniref:Uncharacterized protein n=1 Tax=Agaricus bisporus var. burnettii TaxID=192524 RepID=A0A8H7FBZ1_AGABI|nr:hypothetical protein Agabi119p4_1192 [Agaricus bisporus var. burnettii]
MSHLDSPPPYSRSFPTRFIEVSSESEDEGPDREDKVNPPTRRSKHLTTRTMTQGNIARSTRPPRHFASSSRTTLPSTRQVPNATSFSSVFQGGGDPLLPSSMADLQPIVVEAPRYLHASTIWPSSNRALDQSSPQLTPASTRVRTRTINSSPSALLGISNTKIDKIVADALDRYLSNQRPGMRATRVNLDGSYEDSSTIEFHDMGSPIAPWFAVTRGRCPGIYHDLQEALHALDPSNLSRLEFCKCEADAAVLFLRALQSSSVRVIKDGRLYTIGPGMPLVHM